MPSVLETLPTKTVDSGYLGTGQTLQPTASDNDELLRAVYDFETTKFRNTKYAGFTTDVWGNQLGRYTLDTISADYVLGVERVQPIFSKYGIQGTDWLSSFKTAYPQLSNFVYVGAGYDASQSGAYGRETNVLETFKSRPGIDPFALAFKNKYGLEGGGFTKFSSDFNSGVFWKPRSTGGGGGVFDTLFSSGFIRTFVENPISAITGIVDRFSDPVGTNTPQLLQAAISPPPVNYQRLGIESGVNVVSNVGFAYGVQGVTQGIQAGVSASAPLPAGTLGPVSPGFWASVGQGNFANAWQILQNTVGVATGGPSTFLSRQGGNLLLQGAAQQIVKLTGDVGKGVLQLLTLDFAGALQTFTGGPGSVPQNQLLFGPTGGGGGGGFLPSQQSGQASGLSSIVPFIGIGLVVVVVWLMMRKRG